MVERGVDGIKLSGRRSGGRMVPARTAREDHGPQVMTGRPARNQRRFERSRRRRGVPADAVRAPRRQLRGASRCPPASCRVGAQPLQRLPRRSPPQRWRGAADPARRGRASTRAVQPQLSRPRRWRAAPPVLGEGEMARGTSVRAVSGGQPLCLLSRTRPAAAPSQISDRARRRRRHGGRNRPSAAIARRRGALLAHCGGAVVAARLAAVTRGQGWASAADGPSSDSAPACRAVGRDADVLA